MPNLNRMRQILTNEHANRVRFRLPGISGAITPNVFREVSSKLVLPNRHVAGTIAVEVDQRLGRWAAYQFSRNRLVIPNEGWPATPTQEAQLIHEAVHAYHDVNRRRMQWDSDEMLAYVAGMAYLIRRVPEILQTLPTISANLTRADQVCLARLAGEEAIQACDQAVTGWAILIAARLRSGERPTAAQMQALRQSLLRHGVYRQQFGVTPGGRAAERRYDGI